MGISRTLTNLTPPVIIFAGQRIRRTLAKISAARQLRGADKLHLGCGDNRIQGWFNLDIEGGNGIIQWDLARRLPVRSNTVSYIFTEHFIEHIDKPQAARLLRECLRVLRPGGTIRLSTPDLDILIKSYLDKNITEWEDVGWRPNTPCQMVNEGMRKWGHQFVYNRDELKALLTETGFSEIRDVAYRESRHADLADLECRPFHQEIIFEAIKPER